MQITLYNSFCQHFPFPCRCVSILSCLRDFNGSTGRCCCCCLQSHQVVEACINYFPTCLSSGKFPGLIIMALLCSLMTTFGKINYTKVTGKLRAVKKNVPFLTGCGAWKRRARLILIGLSAEEELFIFPRKTAVKDSFPPQVN